MVSALTLLGLGEEFGRYATYPAIADQIRRRFNDPAANLRELFTRLVFSILISNTDDHGRNHAAFWDGKALTLTPAYDLTPQARSGDTAAQAMAILTLPQSREVLGLHPGWREGVGVSDANGVERIAADQDALLLMPSPDGWRQVSDRPPEHERRTLHARETFEPWFSYRWLLANLQYGGTVSRLVERVWPGNPTGATRAARRPCRFTAYVPDPLVGQEFDLPAPLTADLVDVETAVRSLNATSDLAVNLEPLARFLLRAEAVASSNIEGLRMNVRRLARSEAEVREGWTPSDETAAAVLGNIRALDQALASASSTRQSITVETIQEIHVALLAGTRDEPWAGVIREEQNWIGGANPCSAAFVPPPATEVPALLEDLAEYLTGDDHPALLQAALAHSQFETIHPFADGNGRTGRAIIQLVLRRRGLATTVVPPVSLVLATETTRYVDALMATRDVDSTRAGLLAWTELFVEATARACRDSVAFGRDLANLERANRAKLGRVRAGSTADLLVAALPAMPVFTVKTASEFIDRSDVAVGAAVRQMLDAGVIDQVKVGRRNRAFEAVGLFEAFTGFERMLASPDSDTVRTPPVRPVPVHPSRN